MKFLEEVPFRSTITKPGKIYLPSKLREFMKMEGGQEVTLLMGKNKKTLLIKLPGMEKEVS